MTRSDFQGWSQDQIRELRDELNAELLGRSEAPGKPDTSYEGLERMLLERLTAVGSRGQITISAREALALLLIIGEAEHAQERRGEEARSARSTEATGPAPVRGAQGDQDRAAL